MIEPRKTRQNSLEKISSIKKYLFVCLRLYVLVNIFSVILDGFLGLTSIQQRG